VYRTFPLLDLETEINVLPGNPATSGSHLQGFFGVKAGKRWQKGGGKSIFSNERATSTEPDVDLGGVIEYYTSRGLILRFDLGDSVIHYARRTGRTSDSLPRSKHICPD
jgi:hypothetical protein